LIVIRLARRIFNFSLILLHGLFTILERAARKTGQSAPQAGTKRPASRPAAFCASVPAALDVIRMLRPGRQIRSIRSPAPLIAPVQISGSGADVIASSEAYAPAAARMNGSVEPGPIGQSASLPVSVLVCCA